MIGAIGPRLEILGQRSGAPGLVVGALESRFGAEVKIWCSGANIEGSRVKSQGYGAMISAITMTFSMVLYSRTYR